MKCRFSWQFLTISRFKGREYFLIRYINYWQVYTTSYITPVSDIEFTATEYTEYWCVTFIHWQRIEKMRYAPAFARYIWRKLFRNFMIGNFKCSSFWIIKKKYIIFYIRGIYIDLLVILCRDWILLYITNRILTATLLHLWGIEKIIYSSAILKYFQRKSSGLGELLLASLNCCLSN